MASKFRRNYGKFSADLEDIVTATDARLIALTRQSLQDVVNNAQQSVFKGGRMRVDTGFLRASGQASLTGMPTGPTRGESKEKFHYDNGSSDVEISILGKLKLGMTFYFGWTAEYAQYREIYDGFLDGALQHWDRIVAFNTDIIRERIKK
jgi:hypothetical protein